MDLSLAKDEPISDDGSASEMTYLRKGKKLLRKRQPEEGVRIWERNSPADTKVTEEGGGGDVPGARAEIPLQSMVKAIMRLTVPLQPMEVHNGVNIHLQPLEDPIPEQVSVLLSTYEPFIIICPPVQAGKRNDRVAWCVPGIQPRSAHQNEDAPFPCLAG
ncbi:hypothetical protein AV530_006123 [Patagioenas fasciata monilis]|uniref:Uncharacterized protein n=1 Tax=Patagioenas fasciata monilis TaxID=372326 RepID=A0A1V4J8W9_PATFA|nr:hypothetical protein AV530_006123 [Patagioenas fasciata monilis]